MSIDSTPRGVAVVDEDGKPIGRTPVFHRVARDAAVRIGVPTAEGAVATVSQDCEYRWMISPLENAPLLLVGTPGGAWLVGMATDWAMGAAFKCPERITLPSAIVEAAQSERACPRYLVSGPRVLGPEGATSIAEKWFESVKAREPCAELVEAHRWRSRLVRTELEDTDTEQRQRLYRLGYESRASHLARLAYRWQEDEVTISSRVLDLHRQAPQEWAPVVFRPEPRAAAALRPGFWARHLRGNLNLLPDALAIGIGARRGKMTSPLPEQSGFTRVHSSIVLRFSTISHPDTYRPWDVDFNFGPGFAFELFQELLPKLSPEGSGPQMNFNRLAVHADINGTLHTPLGSLRLGVGLGSAYYDITQPEDLEGAHFLLEATAKLAYTAFLTRSLYAQFFVEMGAPHMKRADGYVTRIKHVTDAGLVFGYHFPRVGDLARNWF